MKSGKDAERTRVLVVSEYPLVRMSVVAIVSRLPWMEVCGEADGGPRARQLCAELQPEIIVLDAELSTCAAPGLVRELTRLRPGAGILALSERENDYGWVQRLFRAGAQGFLSKRDSVAGVELAVARLGRDGRYLSSRMQHLLSEQLTGKRRPAPGRPEPQRTGVRGAPANRPRPRAESHRPGARRLDLDGGNLSRAPQEKAAALQWRGPQALCGGEELPPED